MNNTTQPEWLQDLLRRWKAHNRGVQNMIAERCGVDRSTVSKVISGETRSLLIEKAITEELSRWIGSQIQGKAKFRIANKRRHSSPTESPKAA